MPAHYHLSVPNRAASVEVVEAFVHRVAGAIGLHPDQVARISKCVAMAADYAVRFAYPDGRTDQVEIDCWVEDGMFRTTIHDNGVPELPGESDDAEQVAYEEKLSAAIGHMDAHEWRLLGYRGKELEVGIRHEADADVTTSFRKEPRVAEPVAAEEYEIRRLIPRDAVQVARLVYRSYGHTYDDEDYYYPDRIVAENETGAMVSIVAAHPSGEIVGHYALEQRSPDTIYEGSSAVVNPVHRGKGLMERMREFAMEEGRRMHLDGIYFLPWTIHMLSQKANEHFGAKVCAVNLSDTSPVAIKGFESESLAQRVSTMLYFAPLKPLEPLTVFLPPNHREMLLEIFHNLGREVRDGVGKEGPLQSTFSTSELPHDRFAEVVFETLGQDAPHLLSHLLRDFTLHKGCETVYLNLPLSQSLTPEITRAAEDLGFSFLGIGPCFAQDGDMLRMAFMADPLDPEHIHVLSPFGQKLLAYALDEAKRVNAVS